MLRIVSVWLPAWPIDRLARQSPAQVVTGVPFALVEKGAKGLRISAVNREAALAGAAIGAPLADTRAALPQLLTRPGEPARDRSALVRLADWLGRYGPARNVDGADGIWIDVTGVAHLFGGEAELARDLVSRLRRLGITARLGLADTLGAAHALARHATRDASSGTARTSAHDGRDTPDEPRAHAPGESLRRPHAAAVGGVDTCIAIAPAGATRDVIAALPVAALRLEPAAIHLLQRLGLKRIGQLYGIPRSALERRFRSAAGARRQTARDLALGAGSVLLHLDQALGMIAEPRRALAEAPETAVRLPFMEPLLTADGLSVALRQAAGTLSAILAERELGGRRFNLALYRVDATVATLETATSVATRDAGHVCRLLAERLDSIDAGFGIDMLVLGADRLEPVGAEQVALTAAGQNDSGTALARLVDRLSGRLGADRVCRLEPVASHWPERAWIRRSLLAEDGGISDDTQRAETSGPLRARPLLLLARPEPIGVIAEVPEGAPVRLLWRRVSRRIVRSEGPERIAPEWWRAKAAGGDAPALRSRDYYQLEDDTGTRYWVFREGLYARDEVGDGESGDGAGPRWYLHGLFG